MSEVKIRHSGNLASLSPASMEPLVEKTLSYWHRETDHDPSSKTAGKMLKTHVSLYKVEDNSIIILQGLLPRLWKRLKDLGYHPDYEDLREPDNVTPDWRHLQEYMARGGLAFREGQEEILKLMVRYPFAQLDAPTGYGKTELIVMVAALFRRHKIIVCSPGTALMNDTYPRLLAVTPSVSRTGGGKNEQLKRIVLTTDRSLSKIPTEKYDILLFDEVHRAASPKTSSILARVRHCRMFGLSATTESRGDGADLKTEALFGPVRFRMTYQQAQALGYVAPIRYQMVPITDTDCPHITSAGLRVPSFKKEKCYWLNDARNRKLLQEARRLPYELGMGVDPQIMVAVETITHAYRLQRADPSFTVVYAEKDAKGWEEAKGKGIIPAGEELLRNKERERLRTMFSSGELRRVICTPTWSTGMNFKNLDVIVNAAGATSKILLPQWAGRGSRTREGKDFALLIDANDLWDEWAARRSTDRKRLYNSKGWTALSVQRGFRDGADM